MVSVTSRAKRILRPMARFSFFSESGVLPPASLPLAEGEMPIGIYMNEPPSFRNALVVANSSLIIDIEGEWISVPYARIVKAVFPKDKLDVTSVQLVLQDDSMVSIPVHKSGHRGSDAFEIIRFLDRVLEDIEGRNRSLESSEGS